MLVTRVETHGIYGLLFFLLLSPCLLCLSLISQLMAVLGFLSAAHNRLVATVAMTTAGTPATGGKFASSRYRLAPLFFS